MSIAWGKALALFYVLLRASVGDELCPSQCTCKPNNQQTLDTGQQWIRVRCGDAAKIVSLLDLNFTSIASSILQLNISNNHLMTIAQREPLINLQKLDASKNQINSLVNYMFTSFPNLQRLDLSFNNIKFIEELTFSGLYTLERLKLNRNQFVNIAKGTFDVTPALKQLDISNNPLTCDCELLWMLDWSEKAKVKFASNPKCTSPSAFKGKPLRKLKVGVDIHCTAPVEIPTLELDPDQNQVVFKGDSVRLRCRAPSFVNAESLVRWRWQDEDPKDTFDTDNVVIENRYLSDSGLVESLLIVRELHGNYTGKWTCYLMSDLGNQSRGIDMIVITESTKYCPIQVTTNNKGSYTWPQTIVNYVVEIQCESTQLNGAIPFSEQKATHHCSENGTWEHLNTSVCPFISETTKQLEQFSKINLMVTKGNVYETARLFRNITSNLKLFRDKMDLVFAARTIENYIDHLSKESDLAAILFDTANTLLELPRDYIIEADEEDGVCDKMVNAMETVAAYSPSLHLHKSNIALEEFKISDSNSFSGVTCTWYFNSPSKNERLFHCALSNHSSIAWAEDGVVEASVQIPDSVLYGLESPQQLVVAMYSTNKFFPSEMTSLKSTRDVTSAVVGVKLVGRSDPFNLTQPIYLRLRTSEESSSATPVRWVPHPDGKAGGTWTTDGCRPSHAFHGTLVFQCSRLGYYGLLQDTWHLQHVATGAKFRFAHPAIYLGTFLLFCCFLIAILTYLLCYPSIQMAKRTKHALVNTWIAVALHAYLFCFGVHQTESVKLCQSIGLILHYLTLSSLLWVCVSVGTMYKRVSKSDATTVTDELPPDEVIRKPILGLYLVGWGIALIVCGISGAVNMRDYFSYSYCFLSPAPAFSAVLVPVVILLMYIGVCFLLIRFAVQSMDANGHLSEGTQATENVDLDLLEPNNFASNNLSPERRSMSSMHTMSSEIEDSEHAPGTQLRAYMIHLLLYLLTWACAAGAIVKPLPPSYLGDYEEDVFGVAYAVVAAVLGAFTVFFYCVARSDVRTQWMRMHCWLKRRMSGGCFRSRNVSDTTQALPQIQVAPAPLAPVANQIAQETQVTSRSSTPSSHRTKSQNSNHLRAAADLNMVTLHEMGRVKKANVNLVVLHRQQYRSTVNGPAPFIDNNADIFYNPHQSGVARKFFKKQKLKLKNLEARRSGADGAIASSSNRRDNINDDNDSISHSIFSTGSKVNNTNIHHVDRTRRTKRTNPNPNMLTDSCEQVDKFGDKIAEVDMRTVSQQCSLEYSSETPSDSVLDKSSSVILDEHNPLQHNQLPYQHHQHHHSPHQRHHRSASNSREALKNNRSASGCSVPRIYVNPTAGVGVADDDNDGSAAGMRRDASEHHQRHHRSRKISRTSSVSTSELDDLYLQISHGAKYRKPSYSDSDVNTYVSDVNAEAPPGFNNSGRPPMYCSYSDLSDKVETTV